MKGQRLTLLRVYLDEQERSDDHHRLGKELLETAFEERISGATMFRTDSGIGRARQIRQARNEMDLDHLPLVVQIADTEAKVDVFCDAHADLFAGHLATREIVWFVHRAGGKDLPGPVDEIPQNARPKLVRTFCNHDDTTASGASAIEAVTEAVADHSIFQMAMTGVEGFGSHRVLHRERLFHPDRSMPVMIRALCEADNLDALVAAATEAYSGLTITVESVTRVPFVKNEKS